MEGIVYNGSQQIVTEPGGSVTAGRQRWLSYDSLGMLTNVREAGTQDPSASDYYTSYDYNLLDKLVAVTQNGQHRCFYYDLAGRMTQAINPESYGAISGCPWPIPTSGVHKWEYDANGSVKKTTMPSGKWKENTGIDALNRVTSITYSATNTPTVSLAYDAGSNGVGRLRSVSNGAWAETLDYDALGRIVNSKQSKIGTGAVDFAFQYEYELGGGMKRMVYPSGREISIESDNLGRPTRLQGKATTNGTPFDYIGSMRYAAHGGLELMALGNGQKQQACFNNRLQVGKMRVGGLDTTDCAWDSGDWLRLSFGYGSNNNGNVASQGIEAKADSGGTLAVTQSAQKFGAEADLVFDYQYTQAGGIAEIKYPSGKRVANCFDGSGQAKEVKHGASGAAWVSGVQYEVNGGVKQATLGNGVVETREYNTRWQ